MKISPKQREILAFAKDKEKTTCLIVGPVRSGKTWVNNLSFFFWVMSLEEDHEHLILGKNADTLASNVIKPLQKLADEYGIDHHYRSAKSWLRIGTQEFHVRGGESVISANAIQGLTCYGALMDEVTLYPRTFFEMGLSRLTGEGAKCFMSCNCEGPNHFLKKEYIDKNLLDVVIEFSVNDNPVLDRKTKARNANLYSGVFKARKIDNVWASAEGLIYDSYFVRAHMGPNAKPKETIVGLDIGNSSITAMTALREFSNRKFMVIGERELKGKRGSGRTDDQIAEVVAEFCEEWNAQKVVCDPAASSTIACLRAHPKIKARIMRGRNKVIPGIRHLGSALGSGKVVIHPRCVKTIDELQSYSWGADEKPKKDGMEHYLDGLRYAAMHSIKRTSNSGPIPLPDGL